MNYNKTTQKISFCTSVFETTAEQSLDADISLPDYCPEIQRVLNCDVIHNLTSVQNASGRITADSTATVRILYVGDNGNLASYEQNYPIQKFVESDKIKSDTAVDVRIKTDYANCRAVNPRRVDVRAMLTFIFKAYHKYDDNLLSNVDGAGLQTIGDEVDVMTLCGLNERLFSLNEVVELGSDKPALSQIVNTGACAITDDIKIINNKALIKGKCNVKIYYISDGGSSVECVEHSMPISQIIEAEGLNEKCKPDIRLDICSCETLPKADSSGNIRLIDLNVRISAFVAAFEDISLPLISDAYSTDYKAENTYKNIDLLSFNDNFDTTFVNKVVLESIGVSVNCVNAVWCSDIKYNFTSKDDKCSINGTYQANILYKDSENQTGIIKKPVDFDFQVRMREKSERICCYGSVQIVMCSCAVTGDSRLELKTELSASGIILSSEMRKYVSDISVTNDNQTGNDRCALTIYFCDEKETVWDIAKRYKTTVDAIKSENEIDNDYIESKRMILIPSERN